jgi:dephospho-CoA kinase
MGYTSVWDHKIMDKRVKIIGLTGNIATGKSVTRRMLSNSGALGIDADLIAHRCLYPGGAAYQPVIQTFGESILDDNGMISREKLGQIVFNDPQKFAQLESLTHPAVTRAIKARIQASPCPVVVIEAIKLLESDLVDLCDSIWVCHAPESIQLERLLQTRSMTKEEGLTRINAQPPQSEKLKRADVVINTEESIFYTWQQVQIALHDTIRGRTTKQKKHLYKLKQILSTTIDRLDPIAVESFWKAFGAAGFPDIYERLGMGMVLPVLEEESISSLILWKNRNFTATFQEAFCHAELPLPEKDILKAFDRHARTQQVEILFLGDANPDAALISAASRLGYQKQPFTALPYPAWQAAAEEITGDKQEVLPWVKIIARPFENERKIRQSGVKSV